MIKYLKSQLDSILYRRLSSGLAPEKFYLLQPILHSHDSERKVRVCSKELACLLSVLSADCFQLAQNLVHLFCWHVAYDLPFSARAVCACSVCVRICDVCVYV